MHLVPAAASISRKLPEFWQDYFLPLFDNVDHEAAYKPVYEVMANNMKTVSSINIESLLVTLVKQANGE